MKRLKLEQKEIAISLLRQPKTFEETKQETGLNYEQTRDNLKKLISKGMVERWTGFPTKYILKRHYWKTALDWEKKLNMKSLKTLNCPLNSTKTKK